MPLEHKCEVTKTGCKDINTLYQFLRTIADVWKYVTPFRNISEQTKVNGRWNAFWNIVSDFSDIEMKEFSTTDFLPEEVAIATFQLVSFNCHGKNDAHDVVS